VLFDFDDTLVYTNQIFDQAKDRFYSAMDSLELRDEKIDQILNDFDIANVRRHGGFHKECFPLALRQTYEYYCKLQGKDIIEEKANDFERLGWQVYDEPAELIPGALEILQSLSQHYTLFLLTQGDDFIQKDRMEKSGLLPFFYRSYIFHAKNAQAYQKIIMEHNIDAASSWSIGNSLRSDVNPSIQAGLRAIHINNYSWDYEHEEALGFYYQASDLSQCLNIINRGSENYDANASGKSSCSLDSI